MATTRLVSHELAGALGPILVDVRSTGVDTAQPAIVIVHGFKGFKDYAFLPLFGDRAARAGFTAVNISVSGSGVDAAGNFTLLDRFARNTYTRELDDIERVIDALANGELGTAPTSIGLVGHSRGGGVCICVARETPSVSALVTWSAIATIRRYPDEIVQLWQRIGTMTVENSRTHQLLPMDYEIVVDALAHESRFDIRSAARELACPWLLIHGDSDETVPVSEGQDLAGLARPARFESLFIPDATHTYGARHPWTGPTAHTEQLFTATVKFFSSQLD